MKRIKTDEPNIYIGPRGVRYYRKGNFERSLDTTSQREAVRRKRGIEAKIDTFGEQAYRLHVSDVVRDFLDERWREVESGSIRLSTYHETEDLIRLHLLDFFGSKKFAEINESLWDTYVNRKRHLDLSNHRKVFGYFLTWAKRKQYYRYIPDLKIPPVERRPRKILSPEACRRILKNSSGSLRLFVSMYLFMGMRREEIIKLHWNRVDLEAGFLTLFAADTKTKKFRQVPLNPFVWEILKYRKQFHVGKYGAQCHWVFPNLKDPKRHADPSGLKTAWYTCLMRSQLSDEGIQWHDLRATHQFYAHKRIDFTDSQREKFSGSSVVVQKRHYVSFEADDVRGLESVVQFDGLTSILSEALRQDAGENTGKTKKAKSRYKHKGAK